MIRDIFLVEVLCLKITCRVQVVIYLISFTGLMFEDYSSSASCNLPCLISLLALVIMGLVYHLICTTFVISLCSFLTITKNSDEIIHN